MCHVVVQVECDVSMVFGYKRLDTEDLETTGNSCLSNVLLLYRTVHDLA